jgi:hypothetical protein
MAATTADTSGSVPEDLVEAALRLPRESRARFASMLLDSLDESGDDPDIVREEWQMTIARRVEEIRSGKVKLVDGRQTLMRLREELRERHGP